MHIFEDASRFRFAPACISLTQGMWYNYIFKDKQPLITEQTNKINTNKQNNPKTNYWKLWLNSHIPISFSQQKKTRNSVQKKEPNADMRQNHLMRFYLFLLMCSITTISKLYQHRAIIAKDILCFLPCTRYSFNIETANKLSTLFKTIVCHLT